ncbi:MAG: cytochrome c [Acidimicrobiia bacterium]|nr:cytochrome c [Acidimicrobiia bacterium]
MSTEHVSNLADRFGASEGLIQRSVDARAAATGSTADEVLAAWTGGAPPPIAAEPTPVAAPPPVEVVAAQPEPEPEPEPAPVESPPEPVAPQAAPTSARIAAPAARISFSPWVVAAFLIIPLFGLLYLIVYSNGVACGEGGRLEVAFDGSLLNCDGTAFEGRGGGGAEAVALLAVGQEVYASGAQCGSCHGTNGQGGTGPAMSGGAVLETWPSCEDQVKWIALGSNGWSVDVGSTYGAQSKPVQGGMPAFAGDLTDEEIRAVTAFERIRFGGAPAEETLVACGLIEADPAEDEADPAEDEAGSS